ncbi:MAG: hypothetical protein E4G95_02180 [Bacteroidia bacterium]|nr:MAG: hypothetical protein E4G95_02180 [Bacteroidia bacterium]
MTKGENVEVTVISYEDNSSQGLMEQIQKLAPASCVNYLSITAFLNREMSQSKGQLIVVSSEIKPYDYAKFISALDSYSDVTVILPAYFGPMDGGRDYSVWQNFLKEVSEKGVIITGSHGDMYQLGDISFWDKVPVDVFAVMGREIDGFQAMMPDYKIEKDLDGSSYLVAGSVALIKSRYPQYSNMQIKQVLREKGRKIFWSMIEIPQGENGVRLAIPHFDKDYLGKYEDDQIKKIERNIFEVSSLDLMTLFDFECPQPGGWCFNTLNIEQANKMSTGKNVTVAILDHTFNRNHQALMNRIISPVSFMNGVPALSEVSDHGTSMAADLVAVAPDVQIMPVVIAGDGHWGDAELFIKGINWAVDRGADIISCSQMAIKGDRKRLDETIRRATDKGVVFVYINYDGERDEVIIPGPVEFAGYNDRTDIIHIIGTNFIEKESAITWGVSHSAPVVAGVIAMMKELNADLGPVEIKRILLGSSRYSSDGIPILDAEKALGNIL